MSINVLKLENQCYNFQKTPHDQNYITKFGLRLTTVSGFIGIHSLRHPSSWDLQCLTAQGAQGPTVRGIQCFNRTTAIHKFKKNLDSLTHLTLLHKITLSLHIITSLVCCFTLDTTPYHCLLFDLFGGRTGSHCGCFSFAQEVLAGFQRSCVYFYITFNGSSKLQNAILSGSSVKCYKKSTCLYTEIYTSGLSMD